MPSLKHLGLILLSGILLSLSWPTYGFSPFIFLGFVPLLIVFYQLRMEKPKRLLLKSFISAYITFFIFNITTTFWLYYSTAFGMWFAVLVNSALMALVFTIYQFVAKRTSNRNALVFLIALWIGFEKLHLHWEFSWPWLNLGNVFSDNINWIQWYEYTGTFGGTLWIWIINLLLFIAYLKWRQNRLHKTKFLASLILLLGIPIALSYIIKTQYTNFEKTAEVVVLQPNIDPYSEKYNTKDPQVAQNLFELIEQQKPLHNTVILAPETVFADGTRLQQFNASPAYQFSQQVTNQFPQSSLISGISMYEIIRDSSQIKTQTNFLRKGIWFNDYNSAFFAKADQPIEFYHKSKLVVGVENFPYQGLLKPLLGDIMLDLGGTVAMKTTQKNRSVFKADEQIKVAPIICYESVYGEFVTGYINNGATILGIITNDAWWGETQGHKQHFSYAKLRAVETRRSVARSANTGISGFINPLGEVMSQSVYNTRISLKAEIPLMTKKTFYVKHGDYIARIAYFFIIFIGIFAVIKHKRKGLKR
jgi:apolipoprotein N-acyltransferase